jgi:hypothetical protein
VFSIAITASIGEGPDELDLPVGERPDTLTSSKMTPIEGLRATEAGGEVRTRLIGKSG